LTGSGFRLPSSSTSGTWAPLHAEHEQRLQALHTRSETLRAKRAELAEVERELAELEREERAERDLEEANSTEIDH